MANDKRGLSALQLSKKLEVSYYVAWTMLHKIRRGMKESDSSLCFGDHVGAERELLGDSPGGHKGARRVKRAHVLLQTAVQGHTVSFARMSVLDPEAEGQDRDNTHEMSDTGQIVQEPVSGESEVSRKEIAAEAVPASLKTEPPRTVFSDWSRIIVSNAKSFLLGTFHGVGAKHLQKYLDEFCFRFNRRKSEAQIFEILVSACIGSRGLTYSELTL